MWGIFGKPLKRAVWRCMGKGGGGLRKFAGTIDGLGLVCLFWSGFRQSVLHPYPQLPGALLGGGGTTPFFVVGNSKNHVSENFGRAVRG